MKSLSDIFPRLVGRKKHFNNDILNEAFMEDKQAIFIAVPKTGTTSVRSQLQQTGNPLIKNAHLNIVQIRDAIYIYLLKNAVGNNVSFPSIDVPSDEELRNHAKDIFQSFFKFSAVRNPWARAASLYFRREGVQLKEKLTFEQFCDQHYYASDTCRHPTLHKNQYDWLCDQEGTLLMDYVYKVEEFESAIKEIADRTDGRIQLQNIKANFNSNSKSRSYRDCYSDKTREIIAKRFAKDISYFEYTF